MTAEVIVDRFLNSILEVDELEEAFAGYIKCSKEATEYNLRYQEKQLSQMINDLGPENLESALRHYVSAMSRIISQKQSATLFSLLEYAMRSNLLQPRMVLEAILQCEDLTYQNERFWCNSFNLIHSTIHQVDYKGVRDLLKIMLDKIHTIPTNSNVSLLTQLNAIYQVFGLIFDREACLLPAYLVMDEIQKKVYPKGSLHWKFAKLFSSFIDSFKPAAQLVSICNRSRLVPIVGFSSLLNTNAWKLDPCTAKFILKGLLPYNKEHLEPQNSLLRYILEQPYSRDLACQILGLTAKQKQRSPFLEEQLVQLILLAMEKSENEMISKQAEAGEQPDTGNNQVLFLWQHLSCHLIYFVLFHHASFPHMVHNLYEKLAAKNYRRGREHLMWILLQFISGAIQKNPLSDFLPVMKLYDLLYQEKEPIPVPDLSKPLSTHALAAASIWVHLMKKAENDQQRIQRRLPEALRKHVEYLQQNVPAESLHSSLTTDFRVALLCNAFSTNQENFGRPLAVLVEAFQGSRGAPGSSANHPHTPLSLSVLDSLTVHTKMSLIHSIVSQIMKAAQAKSTTGLPSGLIETYSRLLVYSEIETLGIKGFMTQLMGGNLAVWRCGAWGIYHTLLEMFAYRLHHVPTHYKIQLLIQLNSPASASQANHIQLLLCMENTALKVLLGLSSAESLSLPQFSRYSANEPSKGYKQLISSESEELNKVLILGIARAIQLSNSEALSTVWVKEILSEIQQATPITWSSFTSLCFPPAIADYYQQMKDRNDINRQQLKRIVEEEYKKWKMMNNEHDIIAHFSHQSPMPLFLCLMWKMLVENDRIQPIAYKILDRIGSKNLSHHVRTFADLLVYEFATTVGGNPVNKFIDALNDLIWKCYVIPLDKFILCLALRTFEGNEAAVCLFIIQQLLIKPSDFRTRVTEFVKENHPEHWKQNDWHEKHVAFLRKFPEKYYFDNFSESLPNPSPQHTHLPVYFSNVCLRFLPVLDIVVHRFIEFQTASASNLTVEPILEQLGPLYKYHDRPITYLYNTLFYYAKRLQDRIPLKKKLVTTIINAFKDIKPSPTWALSDGYLKYLQRSETEGEWNPDLDYYIKLVGRMVETMLGKSQFPHTDWRFNEFPNVSCHALHVTCIELMALPVPPAKVANSLMDIVLVAHKALPRYSIDMWINCIGIILTALPEIYWSQLHERILEMMQSPLLANSLHGFTNLFETMDFSSNFNSITEIQCSHLIAIVHAAFYHANVGQICLIPQFLKDKVKPAVKTEDQLLFVCLLVCPFLQRLCSERTRTVMDATIELYEMLERVDKNCEKLRFIDPICDLLYHIKYMYTGDAVKNEVEKIIRSLRPQIQMKLRFITHLNIEELERP